MVEKPDAFTKPVESIESWIRNIPKTR